MNIAGFATGKTLLPAALAVSVFLAGCGDFWQAPGTASTSTGATASTTSLAASATSAVVGATVTFTATVTPSAATGTVTFYNNGVSIGTGTLASGTATASTSFSAAGTESITATYGGSSTYAASSSSAVSVTVTASSTLFSTTTTLDVSSPSAAAGERLDFTAKVSPASADGSVMFYDRATAAPLGMGTLHNGVASISAALTVAGPHPIVAVYGGSSTHATSSSIDPVTIAVAPRPAQ